MAKKAIKISAGMKIRTPEDVAVAAIDRFVKMTAQGASVDSDAWKKAISDEARAFAIELIQAAGSVARFNKAALTPVALEGAIKEALAEAAG
jgi:hypothetical protein